MCHCPDTDIDPKKAKASKLLQTLDCVKIFTTEIIMSSFHNAHGQGVCKIHEENFISMLVTHYNYVFLHTCI